MKLIYPQKRKALQNPEYTLYAKEGTLVTSTLQYHRNLLDFSSLLELEEDWFYFSFTPIYFKNEAK